MPASSRRSVCRPSRYASPSALGDEAGPLTGLVRLYLLRMLVRTGASKAFVGEQGVRDDRIAAFVGVDHVAAAPSASRAQILDALRQRLAEAEDDRLPGLPQDCPLARNLRWLEDALGLTPTESSLVGFAVLLNQQPMLDTVGDMLGFVRESQLLDVLSAILDLDLDEVRVALAPSGRLARAGLLSVDRGGRYTLDSKLDLLPGLCDHLLVRQADPLDMFRDNVCRGPASTLRPEDFAHVGEDLRLLRTYLDHALGHRRPGVNVLVYGPPGTGKTEFVRMLATLVHADLFEISVEQANGAPVTANSRMSAYRLSQALLAGHGRTAVMFDEIEDVFRDDDVGAAAFLRTRRNTEGNKGWVNRMLEENPVPAFWVSNRISQIDRAFLRRFDYVLELPIPPRPVRQRLIQRCLADLPVSPHWVTRTAALERLAPAQIERAARIAAIAAAGATPVEVEATLDRILGNALAVQGAERPAPAPRAGRLDYRLAYVNTDCDLEALLKGVERVGNARICLYGAPGTGKTAFGQHLAERLGRPLLVRRASDLLGPFVGMTEHNIARMFRDARDDGAVLLLDEADSFLRSRSDARAAWEVTLVNEMLTQLERFDGVMVVSTNLEAALDEASLRRFDFKLRFDPLRPDQVRALFLDLAGTLGLPPPPPDALNRVGAVAGLTPGDFATVARQAAVSPVSDAEDLGRRLLHEAEAKRAARHRPIGFVAPPWPATGTPSRPPA